MKIILGYLLLLLSLSTVAQSPRKEESSPSLRATENSVRIFYAVIEDPNHTYGYDIIADNRLLIHQPTIPCLPGSNGFKRKIDAQKVAQFVIAKINKGEMPPTVTIEEMRSLNIQLN